MSLTRLLVAQRHIGSAKTVSEKTSVYDIYTSSEIFSPWKTKMSVKDKMDMINAREIHENLSPEENKGVKP